MRAAASAFGQRVCIRPTFGTREIAVQVRVDRVGDVRRGVRLLAPRFLSQLETAIDDGDVVVVEVHS